MSVFSYRNPEDLIVRDHPLRVIRGMVDAALAGLSAPEKLLRALLLQALYSVRSERQLMERMRYNLLFRWFVGLDVNAEV